MTTPNKTIKFVDINGHVKLEVPANMTIKEWVKAGHPKFELVPKEQPQKSNELRNKLP